jgi:hypothetical protein
MHQLAAEMDEHMRSTSRKDLHYGASGISGDGTANLFSVSPLTILRGGTELSEEMVKSSADVMAWFQRKWVDYQRLERNRLVGVNMYSSVWAALGYGYVPQDKSDADHALDFAQANRPIAKGEEATPSGDRRVPTPQWRWDAATGQWHSELVHRKRIPHFRGTVTDTRARICCAAAHPTEPLKDEQVSIVFKGAFDQVWTEHKTSKLLRRTLERDLSDAIESDLHLRP